MGSIKHPKPCFASARHLAISGREGLGLFGDHMGMVGRQFPAHRSFTPGTLSGAKLKHP